MWLIYKGYPNIGQVNQFILISQHIQSNNWIGPFNGLVLSFSGLTTQFDQILISDNYNN